MKYNSTSQRHLLIVAVLYLILYIVTWEDLISRWMYLAFFTIFFIIAFIKCTIVITDTITYTILLFKITIYKKEITSSHIKSIIFKRTGWISKLAVIKLYKGLSIRVPQFKPENVYDDLVKFCEDNTIHYEKTKDYKIIEK